MGNFLFILNRVKFDKKVNFEVKILPHRFLIFFSISIKRNAQEGKEENYQQEVCEHKTHNMILI